MPSTLDPARLLHTVDLILAALPPKGTARDRRTRALLTEMRDRVTAGADPWEAAEAALALTYPLHLIGPKEHPRRLLGRPSKRGGGDELEAARPLVTPQSIARTNMPNTGKAAR